MAVVWKKAVNDEREAVSGPRAGERRRVTIHDLEEHVRTGASV